MHGRMTPTTNPDPADLRDIGLLLDEVHRRGETALTWAERELVSQVYRRVWARAHDASMRRSTVSRPA